MSTRHSLNDIIGLGDFAKICKVTVAATSNWRYHYNDFPEPLKMLSGSWPIFSKRELLEWAAKHNKLSRL